MPHNWADGGQTLQASTWGHISVDLPSRTDMKDFGRPTWTLSMLLPPMVSRILLQQRDRESQQPTGMLRMSNRVPCRQGRPWT